MHGRSLLPRSVVTPPAPALATVRHDLLLQSLNALALSTALGPSQTANY